MVPHSLANAAELDPDPDSNGTNGKEGAVLIFQNLSGGYFAKLQSKTNEQKKVTFTWVPNAIAIVHTHPNRSDPRPSHDDVRLANRLKVPMFTISLYGMWVYDPATKKTSMIHQGLDWLTMISGLKKRHRPGKTPSRCVRHRHRRR
jgi:hypothetical protein